MWKVAGPLVLLVAFSSSVNGAGCGNCGGNAYPFRCPNGNCYSDSKCSGHCSDCRGPSDPCHDGFSPVGGGHSLPSSSSPPMARQPAAAGGGSGGCGPCGGDAHPFRCPNGNCYSDSRCSGHCSDCRGPSDPCHDGFSPVRQPRGSNNNNNNSNNRRNRNRNKKPLPATNPMPGGNSGGGGCGPCAGNAYPFRCPNGNCYSDSKCSGHCSDCRGPSDPCHDGFSPNKARAPSPHVSAPPPPPPPQPPGRTNPSPPMPLQPAPQPSGFKGAKFEPAGKPLLIIGQDVDSIGEYVRETGTVPAGLTGYTSLKSLEGMTRRDDNGAGANHMSSLAQQYPDSALALGLWLVDQLDGINNGQLSGKVDELIDTLVGFGRKVFLRIGYEADGNWNHYDPAAYKQAFIKIYNRIQEKGAGNQIATVWQLATYCPGTYRGLPMDSWWPGAQYVDWVGISTFTPQDCNWGPPNWAVNFARQHGKPVMIAESASQRYQTDELTYIPNGGNGKISVTQEQIWNDWYEPWFNWIEQNGDVVKCVAYISADWDNQKMWGPPYGQGYWGDTRVTVNSYIKNKWMQKVSSWGHAGDVPGASSSSSFPSSPSSPPRRNRNGNGNPPPPPPPQPPQAPVRQGPSDPVRMTKTQYPLHTYDYSVNPDYSMRHHSYSPSDIVTRWFDAYEIENEYLKLTVVPGFGGRVMSMINKATGKEELYQNPAATPYLIGSGIFYYDYLVVWGGIFPTFPEPEHGKSWNKPWTFVVMRESDDEVTVAMSYQDTDSFASPGTFSNDATMLKCTFTVTLKRGRIAMDAHILMENPTNTDRQHEYWTNVGMAPGSEVGDPKCDEMSEIVAPINKVDLIYGIAGSNDWNSVKWYKNHEGVGTGEGIAYASPNMMGGNFWGVMNHRNQEGIFRIADNNVTPGLKIWTFGFPATRYDPKSGGAEWRRPFLELWGGKTNQFFHKDNFRANSQYEVPEAYAPTKGMETVTHAEWDVMMDLSHSDHVSMYFLNPGQEYEVQVNGKNFRVVADPAKGNRVNGNFGTNLDVTVRTSSGNVIFQGRGTASRSGSSSSPSSSSSFRGNNHNNNPSPPAPSGHCSGAHPHSACGRCWTSAAQAASGGC